MFPSAGYPLSPLNHVILIIVQSAIPMDSGISDEPISPKRALSRTCIAPHNQRLLLTRFPACTNHLPTSVGNLPSLAPVIVSMHNYVEIFCPMAFRPAK